LLIDITTTKAYIPKPLSIKADLKTLAYSVLLHTALLLLIIVAVKTAPVIKDDSVQRIQSFLVQGKPQKVALEKAYEQVESQTQNSPLATNEPREERALNGERALSEKTALTEEKTPPPPIEKVLSNNQMLDKQTIETKKNETTSPSILRASSAPKLTAKDIFEIPKTDTVNVSGLDTQLIRSINLSAHDDMLKEETERYNNLKNSPIIDTANTVDTNALPEIGKPTVITCESMASKTFAMLSQITGGSIQCKQYEIQSFIDKRINKEQEQD